MIINNLLYLNLSYNKNIYSFEYITNHIQKNRFNFVLLN